MSRKPSEMTPEELLESKRLLIREMRAVIDNIVGPELLESALLDADTVEGLFEKDGEYLLEESAARREIMVGAMIVWGVVLGASMADIGCKMSGDTRKAIERTFPAVAQHARKRASRWAPN